MDMWYFIIMKRHTNSRILIHRKSTGVSREHVSTLSQSLMIQSCKPPPPLRRSASDSAIIPFRQKQLTVLDSVIAPFHKLSIPDSAPILSGDPPRQQLEPKTWDSASLFLMDVAGYTTICSQLSSIKAIDMIQRFFYQVDAGLGIFGMKLMDIIGDAYLAMNTGPTHYEQTVRFAIFCIKTANETLIDEDNPSLGYLQVRTAVHSGSMHSIVLDASPFRYTVLGPAMAIVRILETGGNTKAVHCSAAVISLMHEDAAKKKLDIDTPSKKRLPLVHTVAIQLLVSPHKTLTLNTLSVSAAYREEFEGHNNTQTYLVYEHPLTLKTGEVVLCPFTLKFIKVSTRFCLFFGFRVDELHSFRMLCGPKTDFQACTKELRNTFEFRNKGLLSTIMYNKSGTMTGAMTITLSCQTKSSTDGEVGVSLEWKK
jgi:class 3 adenylate cyclase